MRSETGDSDIVIAPLNISMPTDLRERIIFFAIFYLFLKSFAGFKIVFDNIDSTIRPRHMTEE